VVFVARGEPAATYLDKIMVARRIGTEMSIAGKTGSPPRQDGWAIAQVCRGLRWQASTLPAPTEVLIWSEAWPGRPLPQELHLPGPVCLASIGANATLDSLLGSGRNPMTAIGQAHR
jgi:hypothetical protein